MVVISFLGGLFQIATVYSPSMPSSVTAYQSRINNFQQFLFWALLSSSFQLSCNRFMSINFFSLFYAAFSRLFFFFCNSLLGVLSAQLKSYTYTALVKNRPPKQISIYSFACIVRLPVKILQHFFSCDLFSCRKIISSKVESSWKLIDLDNETVVRWFSLSNMFSSLSWTW